jgi:methenyltetrahydrofolate cyclohydrolase
MLVDKPFRDLLDAFASSDPTPGGGSAAAAASALGASLLSMVAALPKTRHGSEEDRRVLDQAREKVEALRHQLAGAVDADTAAYDAVVAATRLPKSDDAEKAARKAALQQALSGATEVPLSVARMTVEALEQATRVAAHGYRAAASDVGVAVALLAAGFRGARLNVVINLKALADTAYRDKAKWTLDQLAATSARSVKAALKALADR